MDTSSLLLFFNNNKWLKTLLNINMLVPSTNTTTDLSNKFNNSWKLHIHSLWVFFFSQRMIKRREENQRNVIFKQFLYYLRSYFSSVNNHPCILVEVVTYPKLLFIFIFYFIETERAVRTTNLWKPKTMHINNCANFSSLQTYCVKTWVTILPLHCQQPCTLKKNNMTLSPQLISSKHTERTGAAGKEKQICHNVSKGIKKCSATLMENTHLQHFKLQKSMWKKHKPKHAISNSYLIYQLLLHLKYIQYIFIHIVCMEGYDTSASQKLNGK